MRTTTIIDHSKFIEISNYEKAIKGKSARNHMKMEMLGSIIDVIGDKWARMSKDTKSALEYICFLAIERGFTYAGSEHVRSEEHTSELQSRGHIICRLLLEKKNI